MMKCSSLSDVVDILTPESQSSPIVFSSPHSGRFYPKDFLEKTNLSALEIRRSEDAFIDNIFDEAVSFGSPLLSARFPRAYIDPNREPFELDPEMFDTVLPSYVKSNSRRIRSGLGTVARIVAGGVEIYKNQLQFREVKKRIEKHYTPYHKKLAELVNNTKRRFGGCLLIDCHSMPSSGGVGDTECGKNWADIVLGDRYGTSCAPHITELAFATFRELGYQVSVNKPYAGGYTTHYYGRPREGLHSLQIEINRALYMDEVNICQLPSFDNLKSDITEFIACLTSITSNELIPLPIYEAANNP